MNSGAHILPVAPARSLAERLFWPAAGLALLALGGFVYLFYLMFAPHSPQAPREQDRRPLAGAQEQQKVSKPEVKLAEAQQDHTPLMIAEMAAPEAPAVPDAAEPDIGAAPAAAEASRPEAREAVAPKPPAAKPDVNPYAVPSNKPYLTHDMFENKPPANAAKPKTPAPASAAAVKAPEKPKAPAVAAAPPSSTPVARPGDRLASPVSPAIRGKIYVLKAGRRIPTVSTVDLGDSYGVKDLNSSYLTFLKSDVAEIISR